MTTTVPAAAPPQQTRALLFLAFTEAWERFSYYGMSSILVLYMSQALFLPDRVGGIAGFDTLRSSLQSVFGPLSTVALASQVYGLYAGFVYFTPVLGGLIADRFTGRRRAVLLGAAVLSAGHFAMAFDRSFLLALVLLLVGSGLLKGNISAQVGALYDRGDAEGRTRGFAIFSMAINSGAIVGPLAVGLLAQVLGWHWGFGLAGVLMLIGLATYAVGYRLLPPDLPREKAAQAVNPIDRRVVLALAVSIALTTFQSVAYLQNGNIGLVWIAQNVDLDVGGFAVPVGWFNALDPLASVVLVPVLLRFWRRRNSSELTRIAQGAAIAALANLAPAFASRTGGPVPMVWPIAYEVLLGTAFLFQWPTLLALVSRAAPVSINATMLGCVFLSLFVAGLLIGLLGSMYESFGATTFWSINAAIAAAGCLSTLAARAPLERRLPARLS